MKMTKKLFLVAIATAAFALTSCGMLMGNKTTKTTQSGTKYNLTIDVKPKLDETGSPRYSRMWRQLGNKETVQSLQTKIMVDMTNVQSTIHETEANSGLYVVGEGANQRTMNAVVGLMFDLHKTSEKEVQENGKSVKKEYYDFVLIGYRPTGDTQNGFYIERYKDISKDMFDAATNDSGFANAVLGITDTVGEGKPAYVFASDDSWVTERVGKLGKDDDGKEYKDEVTLREFVVTITQPTPGKFNINIAGQDFTYEPENEAEAHPDWYTKDNKLTKNVDEGGYRIGGAGYYVNAPLGTAVKANFNSKNDITKGLEEEVEE